MRDLLPERLRPFLDPIMAMCRSQFPKDCGTCHHRFENFRQFVGMTDPQGPMGSMYEQPDDDPFGVISWANCRCGSTLVLECEDMTGPQHGQFMRILREEAAASGRSTSDLLLALRRVIRQRAAGHGA